MLEKVRHGLLVVDAPHALCQHAADVYRFDLVALHLLDVVRYRVRHDNLEKKSRLLILPATSNFRIAFQFNTMNLHLPVTTSYTCLINWRVFEQSRGFGRQQTVRRHHVDFVGATFLQQPGNGHERVDVVYHVVLKAETIQPVDVGQGRYSMSIIRCRAGKSSRTTTIAILPPTSPTTFMGGFSLAATAV